MINLLAPGFCLGIVFLLSHIVLGREVLRRGVVFMDLAVAQFAASGLVLAYVCGLGESTWAMQSIALVSACLGAYALSLLQQRSLVVQEAIIGIAFVGMASLSMLLLATDAHAGEALKQVLSGQILWAQWSALAWPLILVLLIIGINLVHAQWLQTRIFYLLFALAITQGVQQIGIYLVFANLIIPALLTWHLPERHALPLALGIGMSAYVGGLLISSLIDVPSGPAIVCSMIACALVYKAGQVVKHKFIAVA